MSIPLKNTAKIVDPESWTTNYRELLLKIAINKVNDYQIAEDLVQDTFLSAWKGLRNFRGDCSEKTYLCGILRNKIIDFYRAKGRKPTVIASQMRISTDSGEDESNWLANWADEDDATDPTLLASRSDFLKALESAVEKLPRKMAEAVRLWMIDDLSTKEVTRRLGISESNLWVSIHRAKKLLRAELGSEWQADSLSVSGS